MKKLLLFALLFAGKVSAQNSFTTEKMLANNMPDQITSGQLNLELRIVLQTT